jgi:1,4-dihydroxy-2-naphthoate octaprenyltransferase
MIAAQYVLCVALVLSGSFGWGLLLVFLNLPQLPALLRVFGSPKPASAPANYPPDIWPLWFSAYAFDNTRRFTSMFLAGVVLDSVFH